MSPEERRRSADLFERGRRVQPGANVRHTVHLDPFPRYAAAGQGCWVVDVDGIRRRDFINNYTAQIHGHAHPEVVAAVSDQAARLGAVALPTELEVELSEVLTERLPGVERLRYTSSGTEAVMLAVRAARAATGRSKVVKIEGAYHGSWDGVQVSVDPGPDRWGPAEAPASVPAPGVPAAVAGDVVVVPVHDAEAIERIVGGVADEVAAVVVDLCFPQLQYLEAPADVLATLRRTTSEAGALLVFDEVFSNRLGYHGAQGRCGITADLTALGKIIGGGLPAGAVGGRADLMDDLFDPVGRAPVLPHGGTNNANPLAVAAGLATMRLLTPEAFAHLERLGARVRDGLRAAIADAGVPAQVRGLASVACITFTAEPFVDHRSLHHARRDPLVAERMERFHTYLLDHGVLIGRRGHIALSTVTTDADVDALLGAAADALAACATLAA